MSEATKTADVSKGKLMVEAIANGTVIDHIAPGQAMNILRLFNFLGKHNHITVGFNLRSGELGSKDIIKIADVTFSPSETEQLAILAPNATINNIKDYKVIDKYNLRLPLESVGAFSCPNSNCVTHMEKAATPRFKIFKQGDQVMMRCHYCERVFTREVILENNNLQA
ncbi:aspartate carbamoyltransferase regulatory subunit [Succinatimonas hippei]|uniref:Aspartate carbamoyltransferase regulatory chain n=1 Tax=Succinatimonas hippei (strain DSM 22608 / JCM 16073 / KCTC 15190 / YIT 12066) TaxID=762983 RepID=E8LH68_SUCHY|nr:aspartate carbamoyltransferase regulatory subunit [Succinatimonas hippei]EFY08118.1 aspartate carbamoyltransferase, regulatory subunit [Succinatimonas hippei YIT 12066]MCL1604203.1 aspartate carbamoyltransferase regulatory subunit [Succinatimonas hippei]MDM8121042.1 aspartate carbamoyltransferase regulatory subunit [Succinatimonas hippei]